jgi:hypothetical protein
VPNGNYETTDNPNGVGNWTPLPQCAQLGTGAPCYDAIYPAPNAYKYPVAGYFRQEDLTPRQTVFWWTFNP